MTLCSPYVNRRFGGTYDFHLQDRKSAEHETSVQLVAGQTIKKKPKQFIIYEEVVIAA
jgi:hypothetical protein